MIRHIKQTSRYFTFISLPITALIAFNHVGIWAYATLLYAFVIVPLLELFIPTQQSNFSQEEEKTMLDNPLFDWILYILVPFQYALLLYFLATIDDKNLTNSDIAGRILCMGLLCGIVGINVANELGHRFTKHEQILSQALLLTSLYMHFFIEHNRGHHRYVATEIDPASARRGEWLFVFWLRSVWQSYWSAWHLERQRLEYRKKPFWSLNNQMLIFQLIQIVFVVAVFVFFSPFVGFAFLAAAAIGILLLETVNYIEHYGLQRNKIDNERYERVQSTHSWNSNHVLGRLLLFELSRHSDHHYKPDRKYQILRHHDNSPQMPTGYPGMMLLALIPPLWFTIMHRVLKKFGQQHQANQA